MPPPGRPSRVAARRYTRRRLFALGGGGLAAAALAACTADVAPALAPAADSTAAPPEPTPTPTPAPTPPPTPTPRPVPPAGHEVRALLPGTEWETPAYLTHSGREGTRLVVLGGVHGNEPGSWTAAEAMLDWAPERGSLVVVPRANRLATLALERTLPDFGDLNRAYPGDPEGRPMERMARAIIELAREVHADWLIDMHESWAFYAERGENGGTAFIGQTVSVGGNYEQFDRFGVIISAVNEGLSGRDRLIMRGNDRLWGGRAYGGSSSLSLGRWVPGLTPVLVEMGQQDQPLERRAEIHRAVVTAAMESFGLV